MENSTRSDSNKIDEKKLSLCDIMKDDTSEVIRKLESQTPSLFQNFSDLYTAYLHMYDDLFGTCYISEKEFFDKMNMDPKILQQIKKNSEIMKNNFMEMIDMNTKYIDEYTKMRISAIKSFDNFSHIVMESYVKYLSEFNKSINLKK
ncbi:MAG: hypothetical protein K5790_09075 [Nitrosopumilus sp.]|uniref:hypothetical protein n=1 Tax=Nitrosopumilus sp. TaxID=2024843 RepID=UPI00247DBF66|nr:hypothetical protein [Nitrosopumilus sp.]MCV0393421.1 hypothetical protein [Nitrosopumilus sp.]